MNGSPVPGSKISNLSAVRRRASSSSNPRGVYAYACQGRLNPRPLCNDTRSALRATTSLYNQRRVNDSHDPTATPRPRALNHPTRYECPQRMPAGRSPRVLCLNEFRSQSYKNKVKSEKVKGKTKSLQNGIIKKAREQSAGCGSARVSSALARAVSIQVIRPLPALCI